MCGREGYQALWGGGHPRLRNHTSHHTTPHNKPRGQLTSTPITWGVWKGELSGVWGGGHPRQHNHSTLHASQPSYATFTVTRTQRALSCEAASASLVREDHCVVTRFERGARVARCCFSLRLFDSLFSKGMAHFDTHQVGCVEGRAIRRCGGEGTRAYAITLHTTQLHTTNQGDNSLRHLSNWVCGRESCQACGEVGVLEPCEERLCVTCPGLIWHLLLPG